MIDLHDHVVRCALALHLGVAPDAIAVGARLEEDLGLDPLDLVLVVLRLEELENAEFPVADLARIQTTDDLVALVRAWTTTCARDERSTTLPPPPPRPASGFQDVARVTARPRVA